jgi:hypothetical protein
MLTVRTTPPKIDSPSDLLKGKMIDSTQAVLDRVTMIDQTLKMIAENLVICQPHAPGAIGILWDNRDIYPLPFPYLVEYFKSKNNQWVRKKIGTENLTKKRKTRGNFEQFQEVVGEQLANVVFLMDQRSKLIRILATHRMTLQNTLSATAEKNEAIMSRTLITRIKMEPFKQKNAELVEEKKAGGKENALLAKAMEPNWEDIEGKPNGKK